MGRTQHKVLIAMLALVTAIYIYMCVCMENGDMTRNETFVDGNNIEVSEVVVMDRIFPGRTHPISLSDTVSTPIHYNNIDTAITFKFAIKNAPPRLDNVLMTFSDIRQKIPDIRWSMSRWLADETGGSDGTRHFTMSQYLEPNTAYRITIQAGNVGGQGLASIILKGKGLENPIHIGGQHFRALGVETNRVNNETDTKHGGALDGNMGLAIIVPSSLRPGQQLQEEIIPGGVVSLGQIQMIAYNQIILSIRIPDIRIFQELIKRHAASMDGDAVSGDIQEITDGILAYMPWKLDTHIKQLTDDGSRRLTEEELAISNRNVPPARVEASNPSICVTPIKPNGPCEVRVIGVYPGKHYEVEVVLIYNQMDSVNNYRRTHPLVVRFQAVDITGSASLMSATNAAGSPRGIAETINTIGIEANLFQNSQAEQDSRMDEIDKMYNGVTFA